MVPGRRAVLVTSVCKCHHVTGAEHGQGRGEKAKCPVASLMSRMDNGSGRGSGRLSQPCSPTPPLPPAPPSACPKLLSWLFLWHSHRMQGSPLARSGIQKPGIWAGEPLVTLGPLNSGPWGRLRAGALDPHSPSGPSEPGPHVSLDPGLLQEEGPWSGGAAPLPGVPLPPGCPGLGTPHTHVRVFSAGSRGRDVHVTLLTEQNS